MHFSESDDVINFFIFNRVLFNIKTIIYSSTNYLEGATALTLGGFLEGHAEGGVRVLALHLLIDALHGLVPLTHAALAATLGLSGALAALTLSFTGVATGLGHFFFLLEVFKKIALGQDKYTMSVVRPVPDPSPDVYIGSRLELGFQPNLSELRDVKTCYLNHNDICFLYTGLFPPNVEHLHLARNLITSEGLPRTWPQTLKTLNLELNKIHDTTHVEHWPEGLEELSLDDNPLEHVPDNLPTNLKHLSICYANIHTLEHLPSSLKLLRSFYNSITQINYLPETLEHLNVGYNYLPSSVFLNLTLPPTLRYLNLNSNKLTWLPENLPESLEYVSAADNQLTSLPRTLPKSLKTLIVNKNRIFTFEPTWKPEQRLLQLHIRNNYLIENLLSLQESGRVQAVYQGNNWNQELHHLCAWTIQKAFYVFKIKLGIRSWARLNKIVGELFEVAYLPEVVVRHHDIPTRALWKQ